MRTVVRVATAALLAAVFAVACTGPDDAEPPPGPPHGSRTVEEMLHEVGRDAVGALVRGYDPERSADIALVPKPGNVVVRWTGAGFGTADVDPSTTHPTPWDYHQRVPIVLYGPGFIRKLNFSERRVDLTALPPTFEELMGFGWEGSPGRPLTEALLPRRERAGNPKVIALVAYDGGGWNLLERWGHQWPALRRLVRGGTTYLNATIGSAPSVTSAIHANMGTGVYPRTHGVSEITARLPDGTVGDIYGEHGDPELLRADTLGDVWDAAKANEPWVGILAYESWHLGMMSHGAYSPAADRDVAVLWETEPGLGEFHANEDLYELPGYLPDEDELEGRLDALDGSDGKIDGFWFDNDLADPKIVPGTPAFVEHQGQALLEMVRREPLGDDAVTDLLFVELKPTDFGGHIWNMVADEERYVLRAQDRLLDNLTHALERKAGRDGYVIVMTADHGQTPLPETVGGLRVHPDILGARIEEYFGRDIVEMVSPDGIFLRHDELDAAGITVEDVARFVADHRYGDGLPDDVDPSQVVPDEALEERVFTAAIPGNVLGDLAAAEIRALGPGAFEEGDLTTPPDRIGGLSA